jgi:small subunit ribosomal protein S16
MAVAIRFSRQGKKKAPFYRIVAADKVKARDGKFIELLGTYDPRTKVLRLDSERYQRWVSHGAKPSGTLASIIRKNARAQAAAAPAA